ncbi:MAG: DUF6273 domain-containing protein [Clostridiales bacterium]|jgi:hypothetical protein|nr:DUF6273 domain-containing protein [Clostridiales bacterium]
MFYQKLFICILPLIWIVGISGCNIAECSEGKTYTLRELAYDVNSKQGYIVYIDENGFYTPYLVLSSDYNGNVLLLRDKLLEKTMPFNENESHMWASYEYGGYYENSSIDTYLNADFFDSMGQYVQDAIVSSEIVITDKASLGVTGNSTTTISRKVFLLSLVELNAAKTDASVSEGKVLKYFADDYNRRRATLPNGDECAYWTRTPETWETYTIFTIGKNGVGSGSADINSGVRPAFCLKETTSIVQRTDIVEGQTVYAIKTSYDIK